MEGTFKILRNAFASEICNTEWIFFNFCIRILWYIRNVFVRCPVVKPTRERCPQNFTIKLNLHVLAFKLLNVMATNLRKCNAKHVEGFKHWKGATFHWKGSFWYPSNYINNFNLVSMKYMRKTSWICHKLLGGC